jgi:hypothetical protein
MRIALEPKPPDDVVDPFLGEERKDGFAHRRTVHRVAGADAGNHAHGAAGLNLVDIDHACLFENAQVSRLLGLSHQAAQVRLGALAQIVLLDGAVAEVEQPQAQPELAVGSAFHHVMAFEHHEKAVRSALVKLQGRGNLGQAQRSLTFTEQIQDRKGAVQSLNFISAMRGRCVSHYGPLFR